jgi:hypothetical protein
MHRRMIAVALPFGDSLGKLVSFASPRSYVLFIGMGSVGSQDPSTAHGSVWH